jgi:putative ABC transport system permease protein
VQFALREIRRARARFALLSGAVGLLVFLILFQQAILSGLVTSFIGAVRNQSAPILVFNDQARADVQASFLLPDRQQAVAAIDGVGAVAPLGVGTFSALADGEITDIALFGYELGGLGEPTTLSAGRLPQGPTEAVASADDAPDGFDLGDQVRVLGRDRDPVLTIVGLGSDLRFGVQPTLFVSWETYREAARAVRPDAGEALAAVLAVEPVAGVATDDLAGRITAEVAGVTALTRAQAEAENPGVGAVNQSFTIILALALLVVTLVVGFFFLILTVQKSRTLVLLRAVGASGGYLVRNLLAQIALVMLGGVTVGVALVVVVRQLTPTGGVPVVLEPSTVVPTVALLSALALLGGVAAIGRVLRLDPHQATVTGGGR